MNTIFFGTPDFANPFLQILINVQDVKVVAVVSQPDKPSGRKMEIKPTPVKQLAIDNSIPVLQPKTLKDEGVLEQLEKLKADVFVVVAYGKLIPKTVLDLPKFGCVNVHPSLLPKYRGPSPVQWALLNGDGKTGVSIMLLDKGMDTGPILSVEEILINENETYQSLRNKITSVGPDSLLKTLKNYVAGNIKPVDQQGDVSVTRLLTKDDGHIDWSESAEVIDRKIRALQPWPSTWTVWKETRLKIITASLRGGRPTADEAISVGNVAIENERLFVMTGNGSLEILEIQPEGKQKMPAEEFIKGHPEIEGTTLK